jgi:serine/threonine protein kinase
MRCSSVFQFLSSTDRLRASNVEFAHTANSNCTSPATNFRYGGIVALPAGWVRDGDSIESGQAWVYPVLRAGDEAPRRYALKILKNVKRRDRFEREIDVLVQLHAKGPVSSRSCNLLQGKPWYTMPWADEGSLDARTFAGLEARVQTMLALYSSLVEVHEIGIAHRDIKPENVLFFNGRPAWSDFGLCLDTESDEARLTMSDEVVGPRWYLCPENEDGRSEFDPRLGDRYSIAKLAWVVLSGRRPLAREAQTRPENRLANILGGQFAILDDVLARSLSLDPNQRPELPVVIAELRSILEPPARWSQPDSRDLIAALAQYGASGSVARAGDLAERTQIEETRFAVFNDALRTQTEVVLRPILGEVGDQSPLFMAFSQSNYIGDTLAQRFPWLGDWLATHDVPPLSPVQANTSGLTFIVNVRGGAIDRAHGQLVPIVIRDADSVHVVTVPFIANPDARIAGFVWESEEYLAAYRRHWSCREDQQGSLLAKAHAVADELGNLCIRFATDLIAVLARDPFRVSAATWSPGGTDLATFG